MGWDTTPKTADFLGTKDLDVFWWTGGEALAQRTVTAMAGITFLARLVARLYPFGPVREPPGSYLPPPIGQRSTEGRSYAPTELSNSYNGALLAYLYDAGQRTGAVRSVLEQLVDGYEHNYFSGVTMTFACSLVAGRAVQVPTMRLPPYGDAPAVGPYTHPGLVQTFAWTDGPGVVNPTPASGPATPRPAARAPGSSGTSGTGTVTATSNPWSDLVLPSRGDVAPAAPAPVAAAPAAAPSSTGRNLGIGLLLAAVGAAGVSIARNRRGR